ncbi:C-X-C chemokine receptor type 5-like [Poecilia reticulata]|uniref:C-X-C chemokine receptor type 5-like n=1 Tax=Poecilia reticulata TaxID=8081 RepID=UPI0004A45FD8|nr:PREDICTED: C-X-C chemokine receptor type 5-like [Poecilia reticulata]
MECVTETFSNANHSTSGTSLFFSHPSYVAAAVIAVLSCLLGIPTNVLVIVKLSSHLRGSSMTKRLIFNLALSDLLSLFCLVIAGAVFATGPHLAHGLCQLFFFIFLFCITSSSNILMLISVQRYYQILHHAKWQKVARAWQRVLLCGVWILGALLPLPPVLSLTDKNSEDADKTSCRNKMITPQAEVVYVAVAISAQLVVLVFYLKLVRGVRKVQMSDRKKQKINRLFTRILAVSLIDFLPLFARLVAVAAHFKCSNTLSQVSRNLTSIECLYFLNHCLNPLLYFFASRHQLRDREKKRKLFLMALNDSS